MSFVARLEIGRITSAGDVLPLDLKAVRSIAAEYADPGPAGSSPGYQPDVLGYFDGEPLYLDRRGLLISHIGWRDTSRLFACLCRMVHDLGCVVLLGDCGEDWSELVCV